jgi:chromosome segregation ATPase
MTAIKGTFDEIERLEAQHEEALVQLRDTECKLEELNEHRIELAPSAFAGDEVADKNLMVLEGEASKLSRGVRLARNAAKEFERLIEEAKKRRAEERQRLARERFEELAAERYELGVEAEEAMSALLETLERYKTIHSEQVACARDFGDDSPTTNPPRALIQNWLASRLKEYLDLSSVDRYDAPLPQVDGLAVNPKDEA